MPVKILQIIIGKCKQLNEPPPKPQKEQQKNGKSVPLVKKTKPKEKNK